MKWLYALAAAAIVGIALALFAVMGSNHASPATAPEAAVAAPFASYVVGTGITETGRGNVSIGTPVPGVVAEVGVRAGDQVKAGDLLFKIDDRALRARHAVARATVDQATAALAKPSHRLDFLTHLQQRDRAALSAEMLSNARDDVRAAAAAVEAAKADVAQLQVELDRLVVRAPTAGRVLQVNTRVGEYATSDGGAKPLLLLGDDSRTYLRVDIDENDAWRIRPEAQARAFVRGNPRLMVPLRFEYIEPYVTPKTSLTGQSTERTDLRVLQVIYSFERGGVPVYLGQQMDAYIQAAAAGQDAGQRPH